MAVAAFGFQTGTIRFFCTMNRFVTFFRRPLAGSCLALAALLLLIYGDVLLSSKDIVLSGKETDLAVGIYGLKFLYGEIGKGNFPLWNPHLLSGYPMFASFQSMLLYPPAWIWAVLPIVKATNIFIVFHLWLLGAGMIWWMLRRGLHPLAAFVSGALLCLGSAGTMRVLPGHITPLAVIAWMPILLAILDGVLESSSRRSALRWVLGGVAIVALQIVAGFPQHFFYNALAVAVYFLARVLQRAWETKGAPAWRFAVSRLACAGVIYGWGLLLVSVQLLTSWHASKETARASSLPFSFVASFSFPPENFLTLLSPVFFGGGTLTYWGRGYLWEMCLFIGVSGVLLALYGLLRVKGSRALPFILAATLMLVLACGKHTPLLKFLYLHVPIFGGFRASARALCQAAVFLCALAGMGLHELISSREIVSNWRERALKLYPAITMLLGFVVMATALWLSSTGAKPFWERGLLNIARSNESYVKDAVYSDPLAIASIVQSGSGVLLVAGLTCVLFAILMILASRGEATRARFYHFILAGLCIFEVAIFAFSLRQTFDLRERENPKLEKFFAAQNGNDRFLKSTFDNWAMKWDANDVGGYESFRLRRYEEFINWTQGRDPDLIKPILSINKPHPLYAMLRCRYFLNVEKMQKTEIANVLPQVLLVNDARVLPTRDAMFAAMKSPDFNPRQTVLLETQPSPTPTKNAPVGKVKVLQSSTDHLIIEAETKTPTVLLVTDSYSRDWQAWGLEGSAQQEYSVMPANWTLRAIPIQAGKHKIRLEYLPRIFVIGKWISLVSLFCFLIALVFALRLKPSSRAAVGE